MMDSISLHVKNFLSTSIIVVCLVSKLPQIHRVIKSNTVRGISIFSLGLEIFRQLILTSYHYHHGYGILLYLDHALILIQQSILFYLVSRVKNHGTDKAVYTTCYFQTLVICVTAILPKYTFDYLIILCPILSSLSKFSQILRIVRKQNADGISLITWILAVYTSSARVCVLLMDARSKMLLINSMVAFVGCAAVLLSAFYYQKVHKYKKST